MRIQHNIAALNSHRQLTNNNSAVAKNLEKLSSGYRINRAGDDAAGLAISEKMRAQITGLDTAQKNANDGISLVQTAEGALTEVHSMLNRMYELASQSANGTYQDAVDRENIQKEYESLRDEIDRISDGTNFNGIKLLNGELTGGSEAVAAAPVDAAGTINGATLTATKNAAVASVWTSGAVTWTANAADKLTVEYTDATGAAKSVDIDFTADTNDATTFAAIKTALEADAGINAAFTIGGSAAGITFTSKAAGSNIAITGLKESATKPGAGVAAGSQTTAGKDAYNSYNLGAVKAGDTIKIGDEEYTFKAGSDGTDGKTFADFNTLKAAVTKNGNYEVGGTAAAATFTTKAKAAVAGNGLVLQIGESAENYNKLTVSVGSMSTATLGIDDLKLGNQDGASAAIDLIKTAINTVSSTRGDLGAIQNRLEHTINNLGVTSENMSAAESRIRDVDMAQEMMNFTKNNILTQASQAMLAQANQLPQGVLQLLQ